MPILIVGVIGRMNHMKRKVVFVSIIITLVTLSSSISVGSLITPQTASPSAPSGNAVITCYGVGIPKTMTITAASAEHLLALFTQLAEANAQDPTSSETQHLQDQILTYAETQHLLPQDLTADQIHTMMQQHSQHLATNTPDTSPTLNGTDRAILCNFITTGNGGTFPIIILPRLIPIIQLPIPRIFIGWQTTDGITSCGHLITHTGMIATGEQQGFALGFWGIGFSIFLPPLCGYGLFGWAAYTKVTAENMQYLPPNHEPKITPIYPLSGATHVPTNTDHLQFSIQDDDNDFMSYTVTTNPAIGNATAALRLSGTYSIPITGLQAATYYTWTVTVSDRKHTVTEAYSFTTE
jgi:hypothetical protein